MNNEIIFKVSLLLNNYLLEKEKISYQMFKYAEDNILKKLNKL